MASAVLELESFVREALCKGIFRQEIEKAALSAGWSPEQIKSAMNAYADIRFAVPVPKPRPHLSAREAFLYLVMFSTLYYASFNLGDLLFELINHYLPDPASHDDYRKMFWDSTRWNISSLIISFPVFLFMSRFIGREVAQNPVKRQSSIRRWLTYLTLFVASSIMIGDLTTLVYNVLGGELTIRFLLKVVVAGTISGAVFGYYLWDLRKEEIEL